MMQTKIITKMEPQIRIKSQTTIQKWGNSQGIRLPKNIIEAINLKENDTVNIEVTNSTILIKKAIPKYKNLAERLEAFYGKPIEEVQEIEAFEEVDFGSPVGEEQW